MEKCVDGGRHANKPARNEHRDLVNLSSTKVQPLVAPMSPSGERNMPNSCWCNDEQVGKCSNYSPRCLRDLWLFKDIGDDGHAVLRTIGSQKAVQKGQAIHTQGAPANEVFLVKAGRVKLSKLTEDGTEVILDFLGAGDVFGEHAFIGESELPVNAVAVEDTVTCGVNKRDLEALILRHPDVGLVIMKNMSKKIAALTDRLGDMAIGSMEDRLHQILLGIAKRHGVRGENGYLMTFSLTHEELGFLSNSHRVSVTRAMSRLLKDGKVIRTSRTYFIPDV